MIQNNCQKIKLLQLYEMLRKMTDEQHPLMTMEILDSLRSMGISCDRRTLAKDIALLNEKGYEVMSKQVHKGKGYYIEDRSFSLPEIRILLDAVQAANFVTQKKTGELIEKIADLGGGYRAEILKRNIVCFNTRKRSNESIYYNVDAIETALLAQKKIIFLYFDLAVDGRKAYRRDGHHYVVEPVTLVFNEDNYYLVAYSSRHGRTTNYRVDRMEMVEVIDEAITDKAVELRFEIGKYTEQAIKMYSGQETEIVLEFDESLIGAVCDRFGEGLRMQKTGNEKCEAALSVQISPTFWGWLFQFGGSMRITSPDAVAIEYADKVRECLVMLNN